MQSMAFPSQARSISLEAAERPSTTLEEAQALCYLALQQSGNILEIGSGTGVTARDLAATHPSKTIYTIDCLPEHSMLAKGLPNVKWMTCHSAQLDYGLLDNVRLIYIDGETHYEAVKADTEKSIEYLKKTGGGIIVWHHYNNLFYIRRPGHKVRVTAYLNAEIAHRYPGFTEIGSTQLAFLKI